MDTKDDMRESDETEAPSAPARPAKTNPSGKKSVLRQRLRHELDSFNFNALIQGVSTIKPAEETPAPQAADHDLAAPLHTEDSSAATMAEEFRSELAPSPNQPSAWAVARTPANFPGFDLEPQRSASPQLVMASAYARAVASTPSANPRLQAMRSDVRYSRPSVANTNRKVVRGRARRRLNLSLVSLLTSLLMLVVGVAAALRWRGHIPAPTLHKAAVRSAHTHIKNGGQLPVSSASQSLVSPYSRHRRHHRRHRRHTGIAVPATEDSIDLQNIPEAPVAAPVVRGANATEVLVAKNLIRKQSPRGGFQQPFH